MTRSEILSKSVSKDVFSNPTTFENDCKKFEYFVAHPKMMTVLTVVQIAVFFVVSAVTSVCNVVISSRTDCGTLEEPRDRVTRLFLEIFDFFL